MSKKIWIAGALALILVLTAAGAAYAASGDTTHGNPPDHPGRPHLRGEIVELGDNQFTLLTRNETRVTVEVDEETSYFGALEEFSDIEVGMLVGVAGQRSGEETILARAVGAGEPRGDKLRAFGEVTDVSTDSLTIETRAGETLSFLVTDETRFHSRDGEVESLSDIEEGQKAMVIYIENSDGDFIAAGIGIGGPPDGAPGPGGRGPGGRGHGSSGPDFGGSFGNQQG
ncbi:MAG: DUF5666 domain-containing protein [Chloroflexi bacterium]|nr:DUF5666 domain-containing protein [Chloroflexota bacterium]